MTTATLDAPATAAPARRGEFVACPAADERMEPASSDAVTFWEHIYRYRFAARFVRRCRVLDVACGEGYGAAAFVEAGAARVIGVDVSQEVCAAARLKHGVDARCGDAERLPLADRSIDLVVSFETIEHVRRPARFLDEICRVLTPTGRLVVSTPDKDVYNEGGRPNPFHCSEMTSDDFHRELASRFGRVRSFIQRPASASWWSPLALVADESVWRGVRGYWRLRRWLCPEICGEVDGKFRESPVDAVLGANRPLASMVNPFHVRPKRWWQPVRSRFLVAVAEGPKQS